MTSSVREIVFLISALLVPPSSFASALRFHRAAHTEVGKISGNTYCSDCQELLLSGTSADLGFDNRKEESNG